MNEFIVLITDKLIYIVKLNDMKYMPYTANVPHSIKDAMNNPNNSETVKFFKSIEDVQRYIYDQIGFNEMYKLRLNNGINDWVNKEICRIGYR